jgi:hypothetical protein
MNQSIINIIAAVIIIVSGAVAIMTAVNELYTDHGAPEDINDTNQYVCTAGYMNEDCPYQQYPHALPANLRVVLPVTLNIGMSTCGQTPMPPGTIGHDVNGIIVVSTQVYGEVAVLLSIIYAIMTCYRGPGSHRTDGDLRVIVTLAYIFLFMSDEFAWSISGGVRLFTIALWLTITIHLYE